MPVHNRVCVRITPTLIEKKIAKEREAQANRAREIKSVADKLKALAFICGKYGYPCLPSHDTADYIYKLEWEFWSGANSSCEFTSFIEAYRTMQNVTDSNNSWKIKGGCLYRKTPDDTVWHVYYLYDYHRSFTKKSWHVCAIAQGE